MKKLYLFRELLKPLHWIKNSFILAPIFFAKQVYTTQEMIYFAEVLALFCLLASALYIINDILDLESDRLNPEKKERPLAKGLISKSQAFYLALILAAISLGGVLAIASLRIFFYFLFYIGGVLSYSLWFRKIFLLDIIVLSLGYMIRLVIGAELVGASLTHWILLITFLLTLFLGLAKRRYELLHLNWSASLHRPTLAFYRVPWIDVALKILVAAIVLSYGFFTISSYAIHKFGSMMLSSTIPLVLFGIVRYFFITRNRQTGNDVAQAIVGDRYLVICIVAWILAVFWIVYL